MCEHRRVGTIAMALAICAAVLFMATPVAAASTECVGPAAEEALKELLAAGTLQASLGRDLTLAGINLGGSRIEVRATSAGGDQYGVELLVPGASDRQPDGRGQRFAFHLIPSAVSYTPDAVKALLATAELIDRTVPETAFADCSGRRSPPPAESLGSSGHYPRNAPRALALSSAMVQLVILLAAVLVGWRTIRSV